MINFQETNATEFLNHYWQKKPLLIRNALPGFINPLTPEELAGLSLEDDIESRIVIETPGTPSCWALKKGPFTETDYQHLPETHWTLLVQGLDQLIPEVHALLPHFNFIPEWRFDDVMASYACQHGSVGPHYDNYDVFLYQAKGRRKWSLTTKHCHPENYLEGVDLRIMKQFEIEQEFILEEGDMLYLPPHIGHHGVALSDDCITYSFGYRSYQDIEMWDSFGEYLFEQARKKNLYQDPSWSSLKGTSELPKAATIQAKKLLQNILEDEKTLNAWFACFATRLDFITEQKLPLPIDEIEHLSRDDFMAQLKTSTEIVRDPICRFGYQLKESNQTCDLFINGQPWPVEGVSLELVMLIANNHNVAAKKLSPYLDDEKNQNFLCELWKLQWIVCHGNHSG